MARLEISKIIEGDLNTVRQLVDQTNKLRAERARLGEVFLQNVTIRPWDACWRDGMAAISSLNCIYPDLILRLDDQVILDGEAYQGITAARLMFGCDDGRRLAAVYGTKQS